MSLYSQIYQKAAKKAYLRTARRTKWYKKQLGRSKSYRLDRRTLRSPGNVPGQYDYDNRGYDQASASYRLTRLPTEAPETFRRGVSNVGNAAAVVIQRAFRHKKFMAAIKRAATKMMAQRVSYRRRLPPGLISKYV